MHLTYDVNEVFRNVYYYNSLKKSDASCDAAVC